MEKFEVREMEKRLEMGRWYGFVESEQKCSDGVKVSGWIGGKYVFNHNVLDYACAFYIIKVRKLC